MSEDCDYPEFAGEKEGGQRPTARHCWHCGIAESPSVLCWPLGVMSAADEHQPCTDPKDVCSGQSSDAGSNLMCLLKCHAEVSCEEAAGRGSEETPWRPHKPQDLEMSNNFILSTVESP